MLIINSLKAAPRFELGVKVLQTSALPLGYAATISSRHYNKFWATSVKLNVSTQVNRLATLVGSPMVVQAFNIIQLTDLHLFATPEQVLANLQTADSFNAVLTTLQHLQPQADLILLTGDLSQDESLASYQYLYQRLQGLNVPIHWIPGNHDCVPTMHQGLNRGPFSSQNVLTVGGWRIILLNSVVPGRVEGKLSATELRWLVQELQQAKHVPTLIALHHHPVPIHSNFMDRINLQNAHDLLTIIDQHEQIKVVIFGHIHQEFQTQRRQVYYLGTPSTCFQLQPGAEQFALDHAQPGFRQITLYADGSWETHVHRVQSQPILDVASVGLV
jgi:3',5'-cyclic-AMP phosphodiesterase